MKRTRHEAPQDTLTPKQRAFVAAYGSGRYASATAAARAAGYSPRSARCMVHDLVRHPLIVAELEKIAAEVRKQTVYDATAAHAEAERVAEFAKKTKNANAYLGAVTLKARLAGLLVERAQIDLNQTVDIGAALAEAKARAARVLDCVPIEHEPPAMLPSPDEANAERAKRISDKFQGAK